MLSETQKQVTDLVPRAEASDGIAQGSSMARQTDMACKETIAPEIPMTLEEVLSRENLLKVYGRVVKNQGSPGIDGMTVDQLEAWCWHHWPALKEVLLSGKYVPSPVRKVEIPKAGGGMRMLGIPTVVDRLIQQALSKALTPHYDPTFSDSSFSYWNSLRPNEDFLHSLAFYHGFDAAEAMKKLHTLQDECGYRFILSPLGEPPVFLV